MIWTLFEDDRCMLLLLLFAVMSKVLVLFSTRARFVLCSFYLATEISADVIRAPQTRFSQLR